MISSIASRIDFACNPSTIRPWLNRLGERDESTAAGLVEFVADPADNLFQHIFDGDDARPFTSPIEHDPHLVKAPSERVQGEEPGES